MAYKMVNRLDWFDARGNPLLVSSGPVHTTPRYSWLRPHHESALHPDGELQYFKESEVAYLDVTATRDRVYALFCGCALTRPEARSVQVFTWDREFLGTIVLDRPARAIAVTPDNRTLIAAYWVPGGSVATQKFDHLASFLIPSVFQPQYGDAKVPTLTSHHPPGPREYLREPGKHRGVR